MEVLLTKTSSNPQLVSQGCQNCTKLQNCDGFRKLHLRCENTKSQFFGSMRSPSISGNSSLSSNGSSLIRLHGFTVSISRKGSNPSAMSSCETVDFLGAIGDLVLYLQASLKFQICSTSVCEKSDLQTPIPEVKHPMQKPCSPKDV